MRTDSELNARGGGRPAFGGCRSCQTGASTATGAPSRDKESPMIGNLTLAVRELTDAANFLRAANSEANGVESIILFLLIGEVCRLEREAEELRAAVKEKGR